MSLATIDILSALSDLLPFLAGLFCCRSLGFDMRVFLFFLLLGVVSSLIGALMAFYNINNLVLFHIWTLIEYSFLIFIFSDWQKNQRIKKALRWSIPLFIFLWVVNKISHIEQFNQIFNISRSLSSIILTIVAVYTLYKLSEEGRFLIHKDHRFWVSLGVLFYFAGDLIIFSLSDLWLINVLWSLHSTLNIIANLCYVGAFICLHPRLNIGGS